MLGVRGWVSRTILFLQSMLTRLQLGLMKEPFAPLRLCAKPFLVFRTLRQLPMKFPAKAQRRKVARSSRIRIQDRISYTQHPTPFTLARIAAMRYGKSNAYRARLGLYMKDLKKMEARH